MRHALICLLKFTLWISVLINCWFYNLQLQSNWLVYVSLQNLPHPKPSTALFHSLSHTRSREEAFLYGTFTLLTVNTTSLIVGSTNSTTSPPLAFLRSWGCTHFLVLCNLGSESYALNSNWILSLPVNGIFVTSTGLDRIGPVNLQSITLQPHEAIVIKLLEKGPDLWNAGNAGTVLWVAWNKKLELICFYKYCDNIA